MRGGQQNLYKVVREMDVELQILKHLARDPQQKTPLVDKYCRDYRDLFLEVRSYE
jgi:hypothetical protein